MFFNMRRYLLALIKYQLWLFIALLPLAVYLLVAGYRNDRITVSRTFNINPEYPIAVTTSPVDTITLKHLTTTPTNFFTDRLALESWKRFAETSVALSEYNFDNKQTLLEIVQSLSITIDPKGTLQISYFGSDVNLGVQLVNYYTKRLLSRLRAGYFRKLNINSNNQKLKLNQLPHFEKTKLSKTEHRAWWRNDRLGTAAKTTILSFIFLFIVIGLKEFTDPSFKSGRQAARYLNLPIIGFFPALEPIIENFRENK